MDELCKRVNSLERINSSIRAHLFEHPIKHVYIAMTLKDIIDYTIDDPTKPWIGDDVIVIVKNECNNPIEFLRNFYKEELKNGEFKYQELIELTKIWLKVVG